MRKYILSLSLTVCFLVHVDAPRAHEAVRSIAAGYEEVNTGAFTGVATPSGAGYITVENDTPSRFNLYLFGAEGETIIEPYQHTTIPVSDDDEVASVGIASMDYITRTIDFVDASGAHYSTTNIYAYYSDVDLTPSSSLHIY